MREPPADPATQCIAKLPRSISNINAGMCLPLPDILHPLGLEIREGMDKNWNMPFRKRTMALADLTSRWATTC